MKYKKEVKRSNVMYDHLPKRHLVHRTAIYTSEKAAMIAESNLRRCWEKVRRIGQVVSATRRDDYI